MKPKPGLIALIIILIFPCFVGSEDIYKHKPILEEVEVTNMLLTVRVYDKGKPVKGLKRSDFRILENGKEQEINECYLRMKHLNIEKDASTGDFNREPAVVPRLFVLIFNISDYRLNINDGVDYFFDRVLRPNDRLMIMTNRFFLNDHLVLDPRAEKRRAKKILKIEMIHAKSTINEIEKTLKSYIDEYNDFMTIRNMRNENIGENSGGNQGGDSGGNENNNQNEDPEGIEISAITHFVLQYCNFVKEIKKSFLRIPLKEYIGLAAYLWEQKLEKWVLNFYQIPRFPQPDINSEFEEKIRASGYAMDILNAVMMPEETETNSIAQLFVNTGATFHTLLMKYEGNLFNDDLRNYLAYRPITNDSEGILRKISRMTGGKVIRSNQIKKFYDKISMKEDIYYVLAYKTKRGIGNKKRKVTVLVKNKNYKVIYDNQRRSRNFRQEEKKLLTNQNEKVPQIRLRDVDYGDGILKILVSDFKIDTTLQPRAGHVKVLLHFLDERSKLVMAKEKSIKSPEPQMHMAINLSLLKKGNYEVIVMVKDLVTGIQDLAIQEVAVTK
ncbi:MAG: hypothetical protein JSV88_33815 [Candidatus Aminicenantes bacterium]|nr:MAG: hypothetical protein JSV88_33815 [Candidatus Aminicenantes bacterium]